MRTCSVEGCEKPHSARGYCANHYQQWKQHGDPTKRAYKVRQTAGQSPRSCSVPGCEEPYKGKGFCANHYQQWYKHGDPLARVYAPRGSGNVTPAGYRRIGNRYEHCVVWEAAHGPIPKGWEIHHRNGDKADNRLENLEALPTKKHKELHADLGTRWAKTHDRCAGCGTTERPHLALGLCRRCYFQARREALPPDERAYRRGSAHQGARFTEDQVREIRARYAAGGISQKALGAEYGVSQRTIGLVVLRISYPNVE